MKTLASINPVIIVWTCIFEAAGSKVDEAFHTITDFTLLNVLSPIKLQITDVIFPNASREIRRITQQDMSPKRSADNITRSYFRRYNLHRIFVELQFSKPSKNSVSLTILLSCNFKGLVFDFYLNRKRNKCWLAAYSCDLFTYQLAYFDRS